MAREVKTALETDGKTHAWDAVQDQVQSDTYLEDDEGYGGAAIIRQFRFGANPLAFSQHKPTKQELFNSHLKQIELLLWKDGMKILTDVSPRIILESDGSGYAIIVGAKPQRGHILSKTPNLLKDFVS